MSDYDRWREKPDTQPIPTGDDGGAALFWVLVVVVALGVFVFANFATGSVRGELSAPPVATSGPETAPVVVTAPKPVEQEDQPLSFGTSATYTSSD